MKELIKQIRQFSEERGWEKYHTPKNLAMALSVEAAELLEHFQWVTPQASQNPTEERRLAIRDEIGDIQIYLANLADKLDIDLEKAALDKLKKAEKKYPVELSKNISW